MAAAGAAGLAPVAGAAGLAGSVALAAAMAAAAGLAGSAVLAADGASALAAGTLGGGTVGAAELGDVSADALAPDPAPSPDATGAPAGEAGSGENWVGFFGFFGHCYASLRYPFRCCQRPLICNSFRVLSSWRRSRHTVMMITLLRESDKLASGCGPVSTAPDSSPRFGPRVLCFDSPPCSLGITPIGPHPGPTSAPEFVC